MKTQEDKITTLRFCIIKKIKYKIMINKKEAKKHNFKMIEQSKNENLKKLKKLFPELINSDNQLNIGALQDLIDISKTTSNNKGYELTFAGKGIARAKADSETEYELKFEKEQSKNENTKNTIIRGDNLEVLKILKQNYHEKIKMIYIDPPYNTKSDNFIYQDNFIKNEKDLIENFSLDENTTDFLQNVYSTKSHSGWLAFMYPRLKLARDLLKEDGVIFISIDDNEMANLKIICDEIFGEENFVANLKIQVRYEQKSLNEKKDFQELQEYVFLYAKNSNLCQFNKPTEEYSLNKFEINITHNEIPTKTITVNGRRVDIWESKDFSIKKNNPSKNLFKETWLTGSIYSNTGHGMMYKKVIENRIKEDGYNCLYRIHGIGEDGLGYRYYSNPKEKKYNKGKMYTKIPLSKLEKINQGKVIKKENPIISYENFSADFGNIRHEGGVSFNSGKKPVKMLKKFINYLKTTNKNDLILDFFAGSGTTGDAVFQINKEDGGNRKFILVQWDEKIKPKTEAFKFCKENKFEPVISSITIERLNRAGEKLKKEQNGNLDFDNQKLDVGYKVFSLKKKPKIVELMGKLVLENERANEKDTLANMLCGTGKVLHADLKELKKDILYLLKEQTEEGVEKSLFVLGNIESADLVGFEDANIYMDGYADISLEKFLNLFGLNEKEKERVRVVY